MRPGNWKKILADFRIFNAVDYGVPEMTFKIFMTGICSIITPVLKQKLARSRIRRTS